MPPPSGRRALCAGAESSDSAQKSRNAGREDRGPAGHQRSGCVSAALVVAATLPPAPGGGSYRSGSHTGAHSGVRDDGPAAAYSRTRAQASGSAGALTEKSWPQRGSSPPAIRRNGGPCATQCARAQNTVMSHCTRTDVRGLFRGSPHWFVSIRIGATISSSGAGIYRRFGSQPGRIGALDGMTRRGWRCAAGAEFSLKDSR
jgi:hypothetical protein